MTVLQISERLAGRIQREAKSRGVSIEKYLKLTIRRDRTLVARQKIEKEQEWWLTLSLSQRAKYEGKYVAVHNQKLIDYDEDEIALSRRIREKYGNIPILIIPAEGPREIHIYSPRLVS